MSNLLLKLQAAEDENVSIGRSMSKKLNESSFAIEALNTEKSRLAEKLDEIEKLNKKLEDTNSSHDLTICSLIEKQNGLSSELESTKINNASLSQRLNDIQGTYNELVATNKQIESQRGLAQDELHNLGQSNNKLLRDNDLLQQKVNDESSKMSNLLLKLQAAEDENVSIGRSMSKKLNESSFAIEALNTEKSRLAEKLDEIEKLNKKLEDTNNSHDRTICLLIKKRNEHTIELELTKAECDEKLQHYQKQMDLDLNSMSTRLEDIKKGNFTPDKQRNDEINKGKDLMTNLQSAEERYIMSERSMLKKVNESSSAIEALRIENGEHLEKLRESQKLKNEVIMTNHSLVKELDELKSHSHFVSKATIDDDFQIGTSMTELANIKELVESLKKSNETKNLLDIEIISLNSDVKVKLSEINSQKKEILELKKKVSSLKNEVEEADKRAFDSIDMLDDRERFIHKKEAKLERLSGALFDSEQKVSNLLKERENFESELFLLLRNVTKLFPHKIEIEKLSDRGRVHTCFEQINKYLVQLAKEVRPKLQENVLDTGGAFDSELKSMQEFIRKAQSIITRELELRKDAETELNKLRKTLLSKVTEKCGFIKISEMEEIIFPKQQTVHGVIANDKTNSKLQDINFEKRRKILKSILCKSIVRERARHSMMRAFETLKTNSCIVSSLEEARRRHSLSDGCTKLTNLLTRRRIRSMGGAVRIWHSASSTSAALSQQFSMAKEMSNQLENTKIKLNDLKAKLHIGGQNYNNNVSGIRRPQPQLIRPRPTPRHRSPMNGSFWSISDDSDEDF